MKKIVFALGFLITGTLAMAQQTLPAERIDAKRMTPAQNHRMMQMDDLNLTDTQKEQLKALKEKRRAERMSSPEMQQQKAARMEAMKANRAEWEADLKKILTPEQYENWQMKKSHKMQDRSKKMHRMPVQNLPVTK